MRHRFTLASLLALALLVIVGVLGQHPMMLFSGALLCCAGLYALYPSRGQLSVFIIVAIAGPAAEIAAIHMGSWRYTYPIFLGIPLWLPLVWGGAGLYIAILARKLDPSLAVPTMPRGETGEHLI